LKSRCIFATRAGSQSYGLASEESDLDIKGVAIPPPTLLFGLFDRFEQAENHPGIEQCFAVHKNPKNPKLESTIYSLQKFFLLAAQCNPNIIEMLFTDPEDLLECTPTGEKLRAMGEMFLSKKAKFTFSGYAFAQLSKIDRHRKWLMNPPRHAPTRAQFGLPEESSVQYGEVERLIKRQIEEWNFSAYPLTDMQRNELKDNVFDLCHQVSKLDVGWDNWPKVYWEAALQKAAEQFDLRKEIIQFLQKEHQYTCARNEWTSFKNWEAHRNPARKALEEKHKYDVKHAMHLVRLLNMGLEIVTTKKVLVRRPDAELLRHIRRGGWTYEEVLEYAATMQAKLDKAYAGSTLPHSVDFQALNAKYFELLES
jgi:predicted nucleotidyltransferase